MVSTRLLEVGGLVYRKRAFDSLRVLCGLVTHEVLLSWGLLQGAGWLPAPTLRGSSVVRVSAS